MTRENKLALIVAFALILGVSVLLSDHLSSARSLVPSEVRETTRLPSVPQRPIRTLDDVVADARRQQPETPAAAGRQGPATAPIDPLNESGIDPMRLAGAEPQNNPTLLDTLFSGLREAPGAVSPERTTGGERETPILKDGPIILEQRMARDTPANAARGGAAGTEAAVPVTTGPVRNHSVRSGESLFSIAARYYGDGNLWRDLARYNEGRVKPDGSVNTGVMLRIPTRADLTGRPEAETPAATPTTPATPPREPERATPPARQRTYTVASGDTLGDISRATLGTSRRWREIYNLNKDRIPDPDNVRAGIVLVLPGS